MILPANLTFERSVLGAVFVASQVSNDTRAAYRVLATIEASCPSPLDLFSEAIHRAVFLAMQRIRSAGQALDFLTVFQGLNPAGDPRGDGASEDGEISLGYLVSLDKHASLQGLRDQLAVLVEFAHKRRLAVMADVVLAQIERGEPALDIASEASVALRATSVANSNAATYVADILDEVLQQSSDRFGGAVTGLLTGYAEIDAINPFGLEGGQVGVIAGWRTHGKSSLALGIACNAAYLSGKRVLYYSTEMSEADLTLRKLSFLSGVPFSDLKSGRDFPVEEYCEGGFATVGSRDLIDRIAVEIKERRTFAMKFGLGPMDKVRQCAASFQATDGLDLLVVDFIQQLKRSPGENGAERLATAFQEAKAIAVELNIPIWVLSQLKVTDERQKKEGYQPPTLDLLKGSQTLAEDAQVVLAVYQPHKDNHGSAHSAEVHVLKSKNTGIGKANLYWHGPTMSFRSKG